MGRCAIRWQVGPCVRAGGQGERSGRQPPVRERGHRVWDRGSCGAAPRKPHRSQSTKRSSAYNIHYPPAASVKTPGTLPPTPKPAIIRVTMRPSYAGRKDDMTPKPADTVGVRVCAKRKSDDDVTFGVR